MRTAGASSACPSWRRATSLATAWWRLRGSTGATGTIERRQRAITQTPCDHRMSCRRSSLWPLPARWRRDRSAARPAPRSLPGWRPFWLSRSDSRRGANGLPTSRGCRSCLPPCMRAGVPGFSPDACGSVLPPARSGDMYVVLLGGVAEGACPTRRRLDASWGSKGLPTSCGCSPGPSGPAAVARRHRLVAAAEISASRS